MTLYPFAPVGRRANKHYRLVATSRTVSAVDSKSSESPVANGNGNGNGFHQDNALNNANNANGHGDVKGNGHANGHANGQAKTSSKTSVFSSSSSGSSATAASGNSGVSSAAASSSAGSASSTRTPTEEILSERHDLVVAQEVEACGSEPDEQDLAKDEIAEQLELAKEDRKTWFVQEEARRLRVWAAELGIAGAHTRSMDEIRGELGMKSVEEERNEKAAKEDAERRMVEDMVATFGRGW